MPKKSTHKPPETCTYGPYSAYWTSVAETCGAGLYYSIRSFIGEYADHYNTDTIVTQFRDAVNTHLPKGVTLTGDLINGPNPYDYELTTPITDAFKNAELELLGIIRKNPTNPPTDDTAITNTE